MLVEPWFGIREINAIDNEGEAPTLWKGSLFFVLLFQLVLLQMHTKI